MKFRVDVSGQVQQKGMHTYMAIVSDEDPSICYTVFLARELKQKMFHKYGKLTDFPDKLHTILVFSCIIGLFESHHSLDITEIQICSDRGSDTGKITKYLRDYFGEHTAPEVLRRYLKSNAHVRSVGKGANVHIHLQSVRNDKRLIHKKVTQKNIAKIIK